MPRWICPSGSCRRRVETILAESGSAELGGPCGTIGENRPALNTEPARVEPQRASWKNGVRPSAIVPPPGAVTTIARARPHRSPQERLLAAHRPGASARREFGGGVSG